MITCFLVFFCFLFSKVLKAGLLGEPVPRKLHFAEGIRPFEFLKLFKKITSNYFLYYY